jgi:hypothetical protein
MKTEDKGGGGGFWMLVVPPPHPARIEITAAERSKRILLLIATACLPNCLIMICDGHEGPGSVSLQRGAPVVSLSRDLKHASQILRHEQLLPRSSQMYGLGLSNGVSNRDGSWVESHDLGLKSNS